MYISIYFFYFAAVLMYVFIVDTACVFHKLYLIFLIVILLLSIHTWTCTIYKQKKKQENIIVKGNDCQLGD